MFDYYNEIEVKVNVSEFASDVGELVCRLLLSVPRLHFCPQVNLQRRFVVQRPLYGPSESYGLWILHVFYFPLSFTVLLLLCFA